MFLRIGRRARRGRRQYRPADGSRHPRKAWKQMMLRCAQNRAGKLGPAKDWGGVRYPPEEKVHSHGALACLRVSLVILFKQRDREHHVPGSTRMGGLLSPYPYTSFSTLCLYPLHAKEPDLVSQNKFVWDLEFHLPLHFEGLNYQTPKGRGKSNLLGLNLYSYYISVMNSFNTH